MFPCTLPDLVDLVVGAAFIAPWGHPSHHPLCGVVAFSLPSTALWVFYSPQPRSVGGDPCRRGTRDGAGTVWPDPTGAGLYP